MASIAGTNVLYPSYRNIICGSAAGGSGPITMATFYGAGGTLLGVNIFGFFDDNADVTPDDSHVYQSAYTAGETPAFSTRVAHTNVTFGVLATGVVNADDHLFTTGEVLPAGDPVESYIIYRYLTSAAASPLLAHYGTATGLPLTPNGADVTVVYNASGMWTY
jgi:hypothetical protein